jgi:hypothetical protein
VPDSLFLSSASRIETGVSYDLFPFFRSTAKAIIAAAEMSSVHACFVIEMGSDVFTTGFLRMFCGLYGEI